MRSCLNGTLVQDRDLKTDTMSDLTTVTNLTPSDRELE